MHEEAQHAEFDLLMQSQFWPAERLFWLQRERLDGLLRHARKHVPFYATRLDPVFRPDGSVDWDRWQDLPTVKRSDLVTNRKPMLARAVPAGHEQISDTSSSGSTGTPVFTSHTSLALQLSKAAIYRANVNDGVDFGARMGVWSGEKAGVAMWPDGRRAGPWGPPWDPRSDSGEVFEISHTVAPEQTLEFMSRNEVQYMMMGGTDARAMAYEAIRTNSPLRVDAIFTRGTDPTALGRELVARVFGASTFELYSSKEGHRMAHPCRECGRWHVNDEQVLVEILDDQNRPVSNGELGRVVITPFNSFAQPLIRYEQDDLAVRGSAGCSRGLSTIERIVGRVRHMFAMPDGSRVVPTLTPAAVSALNTTMFQVAQVAPDLVEVRYVRPLGDRPADISAAETELRTIFHPDVRLSFIERSEFVVPAGRKHIEFVSELETGH
jgi:phenylacetate-CoA ligase